MDAKAAAEEAEGEKEEVLMGTLSNVMTAFQLDLKKFVLTVYDINDNMGEKVGFFLQSILTAHRM